LFICVFLILPLKGWAASPCAESVASLVPLEGRVESRAQREAKCQAAKRGDVYCPEDQVQTLANSRGALLLKNKMLLRLDQKTTVRFSSPAKPSLLEMLEGRGFFFDRFPKRLTIETPFVNANVDGTEFVVEVNPELQTTLITVFEGQVTAMNSAGSLVMSKDSASVTKSGGAPALLPLIHPKDAVVWALYYPPVLSLRELQLDVKNESDAAQVRQSISHYQSGDTQNAFAEIEGLDGVNDARVYVYRSSLLLSVGRVDEAKTDLEKALGLAPKDGLALSLQAIIAVVQDDKASARQLALSAVEAAPQLATPRVALSYAHQSHFDLQLALEAIQEAARIDPENARVSARLAEMLMSVGEIDAALDAAKKAVALNPHTSRGETVLGFAYLTQIKIAEARAAFEKAVMLDQADPLPRLGLGLATIREGDLAGGRQQIEIAVGLDPNNALIRSYLGKAYHEEKQDDKAATQLDMAKRLDPNDPTPWFYDAIRKQVGNRPVEALGDLQKSIELNDNRAVYRSRLLLDEDLAARSASMARVYNDLGFQQLALNEGWKSLSADPSNYSAHRFLADAYSALPRHEIARASELLQAQLLQPLSLTPVQPEWAEPSFSLSEGAGPSEAAFNEFTPLFVRNRTALQASATGGSNNTWSDSLVASGLHDRFSYSLGQFHYETDGFRPNNGLDQDIYSLFGQVALSTRSNLQLEWRQKEQTSGDLRLRFDPKTFSDNRRDEREEDTVRLGYHFSPSAHSDWIASAIYREKDFSTTRQTTLSPTGPEGPILQTDQEKSSPEGYNLDLQYQLRGTGRHAIVGAGYYKNALAMDLSILHITSGSKTLELPIIVRNGSGEMHRNLYAYSTWSLHSNFGLTLGASADFYRSARLEEYQWNPKMGITWHPSPHTTLRMAGIRTFQQSLVSHQTLEPTQVAGFNQFFDDPAGTDAKRYGLGLDYKTGKNLFSGVEFSSRESEYPVSATEEREKKEQFHRAYLYWAPLAVLSFEAEYGFERLDRKDSITSLNEPSEMKTDRIPLSAGYFSPSRWFVKLHTQYTRQDIRLATLSQGKARHVQDMDRFWLVDTELGYRLPRRRGIVSIFVNNLFDQPFKFYEPDFQLDLARLPVIQPERTLFVKLVLWFY
jgi:tetratricopeptide (TPR) repeat protein